jgi:hypothetical protein
MKTPYIGNLMKNTITRYLAVACMVIASATYGQDRVQSPEAAGLTPLHGTIYVNDTTSFNYGGTAADGIWAVDFTDDHTVLIGLVDGGLVGDFEAMGHAWTLYDTNGNRLIPPTVITNVAGAPGGATLTNTWRSFFRTNGYPMACNTSRGIRLRGNRFGSGFVVGGRGDRIGMEIASLYDVNSDANGPVTWATAAVMGFPVAQFVNNNGTAAGPVLSMCDDAEAEPAGQIFCHGAEVLANGNIVIVGEARQGSELVDRFGGPAVGDHVVYRILKPNGEVVTPYALASSTLDPCNQFNAGVGVTSNGFAIRFRGSSGVSFRLFNNDGTAATNSFGTTNDISMATAVGAFLGTGTEPTAAYGDRGDGVGWHGNYKDAYVNVARIDPAGGVYATVYNADGSVRYHRQTWDVGSTNTGNRVEGAIAPDGRVVIVIDDDQWAPAGNRLILGRILDPAGNPMGPHFNVSELETPDTINDSALSSLCPRVGWRDNLIGFTWRRALGPISGLSVVGYRLFQETPPAALSITRSAGNLVLSWPTNATGFTLRSKGNLSSGTWQTNSPAPVVDGAVFKVTEPIGTTNKYYQLIK